MKNPLRFAPIDQDLSREAAEKPELLRTWRVDVLRGAVDGIAHNLDQAVYLLVALRLFEAGDMLAAAISSSKHAGLLGTLFISMIFGGRGIRSSRLAGIISIASGIFLAAAALASSAPAFAILISLHLLLYYFRLPLLTSLYEEHYPAAMRGRLYSASIVMSIVTGLATSFIAAPLLESSLSYYRPLLAAGGILVAVSGAFILTVPGRTMPHPGASSLGRDLLLLVRNPVFGLVSLSWFLVGFANLWSIPLRTVHLADASRGLGLNAFAVVLVMAVIPNLMKVLLNRFWAGRFDRGNFVVMRILLNILIAAGLFLFFRSRSLMAAAVAAVVLNSGFAGTQYLWNLWVTKVAEPGQSHRYMAVHSFLAGLRGLAGPLLGFAVAARVSISRIGDISALMILAGSLVLLPAIRAGKVRHESTRRR